MMIVLDVWVPYIGRTYDFSLDEDTPVGLLIEEIVSAIFMKERWQEIPKTNSLELYDMEKRRKLARSNSLREADIGGGTRLLLC